MACILFLIHFYFYRLCIVKEIENDEDEEHEDRSELDNDESSNHRICGQNVAPHITEHLYSAGSSALITEDTTAPSFILDKMFHISDANKDRECPTMAQNLISAIFFSDVKQAQETGVHEVKMALQRSLNEPESSSYRRTCNIRQQQ